NGELRKAGRLLKMHPQPFRVLLVLVEHAGQAVTREEIQHCLWRDNTFVDFERGINFCVNQIRAALGDDAENPRYVETLPRRGYRFIAAVTLDGATDSPATNPHISEGQAAQGFRPVGAPAREAGQSLPSRIAAPVRKRSYLRAALALVAATVT